MDKILKKIEKLTLEHDYISPEIIKEKDIKLGLRNQDGTGVVVGITTKGRVIGYEIVPDEKDPSKKIKKPIDGKLYYCGYDVEEIIDFNEKNKRF
ncbi:MAG TPA: citrate synthase, partial [Spirochaetota bacterium]|nr:citrate synthase [Spirochaetota bacterium]